MTGKRGSASRCWRMCVALQPARRCQAKNPSSWAQGREAGEGRASKSAA
nr:hypothetical protein [Deltaproteobacteria bacterium]